MPCSTGPVLLQAAPDGACENGQSRCRRAWGDGDGRSGYFKVYFTVGVQQICVDISAVFFFVVFLIYIIEMLVMAVLPVCLVH